MQMLPVKTLRQSPSVRLLSIALIALATPAGRAELRTFVDQFGRTIKAETVSLDGDTVRIRREDGQLFDLPVAKLSDEDQAYLKTWAAKNPRAVQSDNDAVKSVAPTAASVSLSVTKTKFNVDVTYKSEYWQDSYEEWGYNIQLANTTLGPVDGLRVEYNIFGRLYSSSDQTVVAGGQSIDPIASRKNAMFRTKPFRISKSKAIDVKAYGGQINGVWVKLYHGDTLLQEYSTPETLKTREKWTPSRD